MQAKLSMQEISSQQKLELHKVKLLMPALCRIRQGKKIIEWRGQTETADASQIIFFPAGVELYIENIPENGRYLSEIISIPASVIKLYLKLSTASPENQDIQRFGIKYCKELNFCWEQLKYALKKDFSSQLTEHMMSGILLMLRKNSITSLFMNTPDNTVISRCQDLITLSPSYHWTAREIAGQLHMSVSTLHRSLLREGGSFQQILDDVRLGNALNAIQTTTIPVNEIARNNGYQCSSNFTSRFKKRYKITPRALRRSINGKTMNK